MKTTLLSLWVLCVLADAAVAAEPITLKLWPDGPPTAMVFCDTPINTTARVANGLTSTIVSSRPSSR